MIVYQHEGNNGVSPPIDIQKTPNIPKDITDQLQKLGIQMDSGTFSRIQTAGQSENLTKDLSAALADPAEKGRIEQLYLKGFGQVVEIGGKKYSFAEIAGMSSEKQVELQGQIQNPILKIKLGGYLNEAANQTETKIDTNIQAANQRKKTELSEEQAAIEITKRINKDLQSSTDQIRSLSSLPAGIEDKALEEAKKNPPSQLKDVPPESYGEYKNLILANYAITHHAEIHDKLSDTDKIVFGTAIKDASNILGLQKEDFPKLIEGKVFGAERQKIESRGKELIEKGYNKEVIWNPSDRSITFTNKNGDIRVIETAHIPPQESIVKNGLRISRDIEPVSPEEQKRKEKEKDLVEKKGKTKLTESSYDALLKTEGYKNSYDSLGKQDSIKQLVGEKQELNNRYSTLIKTNEKLDTVTDTIRKIEQINDERKKYPELLSDTKIENTLETEKFALQDVQRSLTQELQAEKDIPAGSPTKKLDTGFESNAAYNLNFLSYIGYDGLGQDELNRVIERLNSSSNPRRGEIGEIRLGDKLDTPKTQALTLAIANLVRGGRQSGISPTPEQAKQEKEQKTWDGVDKTDPIIAARQTRSFGFRDSLISVRRNMTQEGGTLKTRGQLDKALFGIEPVPEVNNSAENTTTPAESMTSFA